MATSPFKSLIRQRLKKSVSYVSDIAGISLFVSCKDDNGIGYLSLQMISYTPNELLGPQSISRSFGKGFDAFGELWDEFLKIHMKAVGKKRIPKEWKNSTPTEKDYNRILKDALALYNKYYDDEKYSITKGSIGARSRGIDIPINGLSLNASVYTRTTKVDTFEEVRYTVRVSLKIKRTPHIKSFSFYGKGDLNTRWTEALIYMAKITRTKTIPEEWKQCEPTHADLKALELRAWDKYERKMDAKLTKDRSFAKAA